MTHAWAQDPAASLTALEVAEAHLDDATPGERPEWFDYYDRSRLTGFKGQVHILLTQPDKAHTVLEEAIGALEPEATKQRACYLADRARVCVEEGEVEQACQLGIQALQRLSRSSTRPACSGSATCAPGCGPGATTRLLPT